MEKVIENITKEDELVKESETTEKSEETVLLDKLPPPTPEEMEQLKTMSFEDRKYWLNKRAFSLCETESTIGKQVAAVLCYPSPKLLEEAEPVTDFGQVTQNIIDLMINTVYTHKGMGLAATQIGYNKQIFIIDCAANSENSASDLRVFINPELTALSKEKVRNGEGCLSFPGLYEQVFRSKSVAGKALDREGKEFEFDHSGDVFAVAIQHENDHLHGINIIDHLQRLAKRFAMKKLQKGINKQNQKPKQFQRRSW